MTFIAPVIHVETLEQARRNVEIVLGSGADGMFLINHSIEAEVLIKILREMRFEYPKAWMGVNFLDLEPLPINTMRIPAGVKALWSDNSPTARLSISMFGGVGFKYQHWDGTLEEELEAALPYVDIVTTSGPATGQAPTTEKIRYLHRLLAGRRPLAVASGMTPENVAVFVPYLDYILVATGVSRSFTELDPMKLSSFVEVIREAGEWQKPSG